VLYEFVFLEIDACFFGADKTGRIINNITYSYIAGYIFYFLSVYISRRYKIKSSKQLVFYSINLIIELGKQYTKKLGGMEKYDFKNDFPTTNEWDEFVNNVGENSIKTGGENNFVKKSTEDVNLLIQIIFSYSDLYYNLMPIISSIYYILNSGLLLSNFTNLSEQNAYLNLEQTKSLLNWIKKLQEEIRKDKDYVKYEQDLIN
jgi:hypothetical protein